MLQYKYRREYIDWSLYNQNVNGVYDNLPPVINRKISYMISYSNLYRKA